MRGFDDVSFDWSGQKYHIPAHRVLGAIARVEDIITLQELQKYGAKGTAPLAKLSMAYGALLRYANAKVTDVEIYEAMFGKDNSSATAIIESIINLIVLMVPPSAQKQKEEKPSVGNLEAAALEMATKKLSKKPTKLRSRKKVGK